MEVKTRVETTINGERVEFLCEPRQSLLECLRDIAGLTGTKEGCNDGNCGACTVMFDGRIVTSCLVLGVEADGSEITTIEGVAEGSALHEIQKAFLEGAALQCGVCTPGFIVAAKLTKSSEDDPSTVPCVLVCPNRSTLRSDVSQPTGPTTRGRCTSCSVRLAPRTSRSWSHLDEGQCHRTAPRARERSGTRPPRRFGMSVAWLQRE